MQDNFDDIWDLMLKLAVTENSYNEISDYPSIEVINQIELPKQYDAKMKKVIKRYQVQIRMNKIGKYMWKTVSLLLLGVGILFIILLQFDEVRASCINTVMQIYEKFIQYDFKSSNKEENVFDVEFIPKGYYLDITETNDNGVNMIYRNSLGYEIEIAFFNDNRTIYLDNEHYQIEDVQVNNVIGKFYEAESRDFDNYITWNTEKGYFYIAALLDKDAMKKIAENVK